METGSVLEVSAHGGTEDLAIAKPDNKSHEAKPYDERPVEKGKENVLI